MAIKYNGDSYKPSGIKAVRYNGNDYLRTAPVLTSYTITITNQTTKDFSSFSFRNLTKISGPNTLAKQQSATFVFEKSVLGEEFYQITCKNFAAFVDSGSTYDGAVTGVDSASGARIHLTTEYGVGSVIVKGFDD